MLRNKLTALYDTKSSHVSHAHIATLDTRMLLVENGVPATGLL